MYNFKKLIIGVVFIRSLYSVAIKSSLWCMGKFLEAVI